MENEKILTNPAEEPETAVAEPAPAEEIVTEVAAPEETEETVEVEEATEAPAEPAKRQTRARRASSNVQISNMILDDGNDMVAADMPQNRQYVEMEKMRLDITKKNICYGRVLGLEITDDEKVRMIVKRDTLRIVIPGADFFKYSQMKDIDKASESEKFIRYRRKGTHMFDGIISFIPLSMDFDEDGIPFVIASRAQAMEQLQEKHFFGRRADATVGSVAKASIVSSGPRYVTVECLGVETTIGSGELSAFSFIDNVSEEFHPGDGLYVAITKLDVDKENRTIDIAFSHAAVERQTAMVEKVSERLLGSRYTASVSGQNDSFYFVILHGTKIRGIVPKDKYKGLVPLLKGDTVSFLTTGISKEKNMLIGGCIKAQES